MAFRALPAATLACLMTACMAGIFYRSDSVLFRVGLVETPEGMP